MSAVEKLITEPVVVFYTNGLHESEYVKHGELLMVDDTGVLVGSGIKPHKLTFIPASRIIRIESQT